MRDRERERGAMRERGSMRERAYRMWEAEGRESGGLMRMQNIIFFSLNI